MHLVHQPTLGQRVNLATIVLTLTTSAAKGATPSTTAPAATTPTTAAPKEAKPLPGFQDGLENGWHVFTIGGTVVLACLGAALPFLPFALFSFGAWRLARRRRESGNGRPATMPAA